MKVTEKVKELVSLAAEGGFDREGLLALVLGRAGGLKEKPIVSLKEVKRTWSGPWRGMTPAPIQQDTRTYEELSALALKGKLDPPGQKRLQSMLDEQEQAREDAREEARFRACHAGMSREEVNMMLREGGAR
jgi:hypothetical protein